MREKPTRKRRFTRRGVALAATLATVMLALPAFALAHLERPSYWPDPRPDNTVSPPAGGEVPDGALAAQSRGPSRRGTGRSDVLVVCKGKRGGQSLALPARVGARGPARRATASVRASRRSSSPSAEAQRLLAINDALAAQCDYDSVQAAVLDAGNNDRIVIMPGRYTEPASRSSPGERPDLQPRACSRRTPAATSPRATSTRSPVPTTRT